MPALARQNARVARGTRQLERLVAKWLERFGTFCMRRELRKRGWVHKQDDDEQRLRDELAALFSRFGLKRAVVSARAAGEEVGTPIVIPGSLVTDAIAGRDIPLKWMERFIAGAEQRADDVADDTADRVRRAVRQIIADARAESPVPSAGEIARRIRTTILATDARGPFALSSERAAIVAQTEVGIAENTGTFEGYKMVGVTEIEWLARTDGRSGNRHHERMNGKRVKLGEKFTMPSGAKLRYPQDPLGPVGEIVNCRCSSAAVIRRDKT